LTDNDTGLLEAGGQVTSGKMINRLGQLPRKELMDRQAVFLFTPASDQNRSVKLDSDNEAL
jgi:hypothetical protein